MLNEIKLTDIGDFKIGHAQNDEAATGCTVFLFENGARAGLDVRGGGPASRESELLKPLAAADAINAILLAGGSAFGLDAAGGVMRYLEEKGVGLDMGVATVPLVCQSCLFDLTVGDPTVRPDADMAYAACVAAEQNDGVLEEGNVGAGTGATVGKTRGPAFCMKSGIGSYAVEVGSVKIGALVVVNALGDVFDYKTGNKIAGVIGEEGALAENDIITMYEAIAATAATHVAAAAPAPDTSANPDTSADSAPAATHVAAAAHATDSAAPAVTNTTLGVILTNARFNKSQLCKIASVAQDGVARAIRPVHTSMDGDSIYAVSLGNIPCDLDLIASLGAQVVSEAIKRAVQNAHSAYGIPGAADEPLQMCP